MAAILGTALLLLAAALPITASNAYDESACIAYYKQDEGAAESTL